MASSEINEFLSGPLVTWFISCLENPESLINYEDLVDGILLHSVFRQIDPEPLHDEIVPSDGNPLIRAKNLEAVVGNMKQFYEEELGHLILTLPDTTKMGREPELCIGDMKLILLLLLGCAVQCPNKETFITKIKELAVHTQLAIVECIKQVTDYQDIVLTQDTMDSVSMEVIFVQIKKLVKERDLYREKWKVAAITENTERSGSSINVDAEEISKVQQRNFKTKSHREENHHYAVELADWKSKVRKQRQELEEKTEALLECKEELEQSKTLLSKFKQENQELMHEARTAKSYRDELDAVIERAERADRLEVEVARYREKLTDIEFYKTRLEELREDNRVLMETREMLEEQLSSSRRRVDKVLELEAEIIKYKQLVNDMALEQAADKEKFQEVCEENAQLLRLTKAAADEAALSGSISDPEELATTDNRLSEQLTNNAQARILKLELENRRLITMNDSLKENSFHESSTRVLELEKEKKKLSLKVESLSDNCAQLAQQNTDLELVCKQALEENKKLQNSLKSQRTSFEKQQQELQARHEKIMEMEKNYDSIVKEKQRAQSLLESAQRRAEDMEHSLKVSNDKLQDLEVTANNVDNVNVKCIDLESKIVTLEKEKEIAQRDILKYRETIEERDVAIDKATDNIEALERKVTQLKQEVDNSTSQIARLQEIERSSMELDSRAAIDREALETLQTNLVAEKLNTQQLYTVLEKLGLNVDMLLTLPSDSIFERIASIAEVENYIRKTIQDTTCSCKETVPESTAVKSNEDAIKNHCLQEEVKVLKKELENIQIKLSATSECLLSENAKLQVHVTTLQSQNTSLATQHTALQLANSQLVAEKEELLKERGVQQHSYAYLVRDQKTLQSLHEQLNNEYENLLQERETLKTNLRDVKNETKVLRESCEKMEETVKTLQSEKESFNSKIESFDFLQDEHLKLQDDFKKLYSSMEGLALKYSKLYDDYGKIKVENNRMTLMKTEMQGELDTKTDRCNILEIQFKELSRRCDKLLLMNSTLDSDRRTLMDQTSVLFNNYHELLTHSFEDREYYYKEEKKYMEQVNQLCRQKEMLEAKIMEHYKNMDSCSAKKKSFGASFVRKMRKAGSDLLNKNRRSWTEDSKQSESEGKVYETDSDASTDDHQAVESTEASGLGNDHLSLGHPGTRRTVYYTDDASPSTANLTPDKGLDESLQQPEEDAQTNRQDQSTNSETQNEVRPLLIFNKVSAVINESKRVSPTKDAERNEAVVNPNDKNHKTGSPVWYEYGCV